jgi:hypothetical protein
MREELLIIFRLYLLDGGYTSKKIKNQNFLSPPLVPGRKKKKKEKKKEKKKPINRWPFLDKSAYIDRGRQSFYNLLINPNQRIKHIIMFL